MRFAASTLTVSLAVSSAVSASELLEARQEALKPFEVTATVFNSPNGRPGSYPCMSCHKLLPRKQFADLDVFAQGPRFVRR